MASIGYAFVTFPEASALYCQLVASRPGCGAGAGAGGGGGGGGGGAAPAAGADAWAVAAAAASGMADALARAQVRGPLSRQRCLAQHALSLSLSLLAPARRRLHCRGTPL
jgi:hypothetical protein